MEAPSGSPTGSPESSFNVDSVRPSLASSFGSLVREPVAVASPSTPRSIPIRTQTPPVRDPLNHFDTESEREAASALVALFSNLRPCSPAPAPRPASPITIHSPSTSAPASPLQSPKKRHRRTNDELTKDFKCTVEGCSKAYASAGALKTHQSLKHSGASMPLVIPLSPSSKRHQNSAR